MDNLVGWHLLIILAFGFLPLITAAIGIPSTLVPHYTRVKRGEIEQNATFNTFSIVSLVLAFVFAIVGVVLAHVALSQIKKSHDRGWGLAVSALWIGYWNVLLGLLVIAGWVASISTSLGAATRIAN